MVDRYLFFIACLLLVSVSAHADIYKWVDKQGKNHITDRPPLRGEAKPISIRVINTYTTPRIVSKKSNPTGGIRKVIMYSTRTCGVCKKAKAYFRSKGIPFTEYDVQKSIKGRRDFKRLGGRGVPIILVGESRMNGFSPTRFEQLYKGS